MQNMFRFLHVRGLTIITPVRLGVKDKQHCLREVPILIHVIYFCGVGPNRKLFDQNQNI